MKQKIIVITGGLLVLLAAGALLIAGNNKARHSNEIFEKRINNLSFTLKPFTSAALFDINYSGKQVSKQQRDSIISEYDAFTCFVFEIGIDGYSGRISDYSPDHKTSGKDQRVNYYLFEMQNDLKLVDKTNTEIPCTIYYYEQLSGISPTNRFVIGFTKTKHALQTFEYRNHYLNTERVTIDLTKHFFAFN